MYGKTIKNNKFFLSLTMVIVLITSIVTIFQFFQPEVLNILRRDPERLASGEWWRIITPLLVHSDGWGQYIFNIVCIIVIGIEVERLYGKIDFLFLYLAGGLIGEIAGYAWEPYGAGASVGLCGLLGGLYIITLISRKKVANPLSLLLSLYIVVGLVSFASGRIYVSIGLFIMVGVLTGIIMKRKNPEKADKDNSSNIDLKESLSLAFALSINNIGLGIGASITGLNIFLTSLFTFIFSLLMLLTGYFLGSYYLSKLFSKRATIVSGLIIIALGVYEIFI